MPPLRTRHSCVRVFVVLVSLHALTARHLLHLHTRRMCNMAKAFQEYGGHLVKVLGGVLCKHTHTHKAHISAKGRLQHPQTTSYLIFHVCRLHYKLKLGTIVLEVRIKRKI